MFAHSATTTLLWYRIRYRESMHLLSFQSHEYDEIRGTDLG